MNEFIPLSPRELEILTLIAKGLESRRISRRLSISIGTVRTHMERIRTKLGAFSRAQAVAKAITFGILQAEALLVQMDGDVPLSLQEQRVLNYAAQGMTTRQTAERLKLRPCTVRTHREHILEKLGARTMAQAVARHRLVATDSR